jgi:DNA-binding transcriptional LysR family regulator
MRERDVVSGMGVFVAVVEGGSLTAAARRTGLTPSAVSKLVARLERDFGVPLLRRTTRSMTVTDVGQSFFERARAILDDLRAFEQEIASKSVEPRGVLRVSAPLLFGQARVHPILIEFLKKTPGVSLDLDLSDRAVDIVGERIDIAVRITSEPPASFVARRVGTVRRVLCASPAYLRTRRLPRKPSDLAQHACLLLSGHGSTNAWHFRAQHSGGAPESVRIHPRLRVGSTLSLHEAALAGLGIADLPSYLVEDDLRARRLVRVLEPFAMEERGVFVVYAAGPLLPVRVRDASSYLVRRLTSTFQGR